MNISKVPSPFRVARTYFKYRFIQPLVKRPFLPRRLVLFVNNRCNAHCVMCGIWENNNSNDHKYELTLEELELILADRLFKQIENLNINGGELTLRDDLPNVVQTAVKKLPALKEISMISNGLLTHRLINQVEQIKKICDPMNISLMVSISVHGLHGVADKVFGIQGAFEQQIRTINALQEIASDGNFGLGISCVVMNENIHDLQPLLQWAIGRKLHIRFSVVEKRDRFNNLAMGEQCELSAGNIEIATEFFRDLSRQKSLLKTSAYAYDYLANMLQCNQVRTMSCDYILGEVILGSRGELYYCPHDKTIGNGRERSAFEIYYDAHNISHRTTALIQQKCLHCPPKHSGPLSIQVDIFRYIKFLLSTDL